MTTGISLLAGADFIYLITAHGDCESSVYLSRTFLVAAVNISNTLNFFNDQVEGFKTTQSGYQAQSSLGFMKGCIGCIDSLFLEKKQLSI